MIVIQKINNITVVDPQNVSEKVQILTSNM